MRTTTQLSAGPYQLFSLSRADLMELVRLRLTTMILITVGVGFVLASVGPLDIPRLLGVLLGLGLISSGATALNQVIERESDAKMRRTANRPLPAGRLDVTHARVFGSVLSLVGIGVLYLTAGWFTAFLGAASAAVYVFAYTPLKSRSSYNTLVGAISGALPPVVGWVGAADAVSLGALSLFAILFVWQLIHLFAIAWLYREDYARAGMVMVSVVDTVEGRLTMRLIVLFCLSLLPVSLLPVAAGLFGWTYAVISILLGSGFLVAGIQLARRRTPRNAQKLFYASIIYLPLLLTTMLLTRL